jgi:hypothetical protein
MAIEEASSRKKGHLGREEFVGEGKVDDDGR